MFPMMKVSNLTKRDDSLKIGGVLYVIAAFQFLVFELVAETLYPGYSVSNNYISDLGATCIAPPSNYELHRAPTLGHNLRRDRFPLGPDTSRGDISCVPRYAKEAVPHRHGSG